MIVKGHIQTSDIEIARIEVEDLHQFSPIDCTVCLKCTAAGTGHINADTHVFCTVVQDRDILKEVPLTVTVPALDEEARSDIRKAGKT